jgi:hypothetical protein
VCFVVLAFVLDNNYSQTGEYVSDIDLVAAPYLCQLFCNLEVHVVNK